MSFLRQRNGRGGPAEDDVEANAGMPEGANEASTAGAGTNAEDSAVVTGSNSAEGVSPGSPGTPGSPFSPATPGQGEQHPHSDSHIKFPGKLPAPPGHHGGGGNEGALDEYEALDRYITNFDAERRASMISSGGRSRKPHRWWQFWKSSADPDKDRPGQDEGKAPDHWLDTDLKQGVSSAQVEERRRRFGWNELQAEKQDMLRQLLGYFQGPILYGTWSSLCNETVE
jgi:hypothetical protein